jgi:predicted DNA-binding transcriptional regulator AlpA
MATDVQGLLDTAEAAQFLGLSPGTLRLWRYLDRPDQPAFVRVGRLVKYQRHELERFAASRTHQPGNQTSTKNCDPSHRKGRPGPQR